MAPYRYYKSTIENNRYPCNTEHTVRTTNLEKTIEVIYDTIVKNI